MVSLFYTTYISVDRAHHEIFRAKAVKGGITSGGQTKGYRNTSRK